MCRLPNLAHCIFSYVRYLFSLDDILTVLIVSHSDHTRAPASALSIQPHRSHHLIETSRILHKTHHILHHLFCLVRLAPEESIAPG